tara:strand:- start:173 stop:370 length:198 start_codon:yes stop_codon:yes gene_type:complete
MNSLSSKPQSDCEGVGAANYYEIAEQFEQLNGGLFLWGVMGVAIIKTLKSLTYNEPKSSAKYKVI